MEPEPLNRRDFVRLATLTGVLAAADLPGLAAESGAKLKAAVIGHTGRGDYGHGLEGIFGNQPNIEVVALADPDSEGRARTAGKIGAARSYADYHEMLEKEHPGLVSIAMRQSDQHHTIALAALKAGAHVYCEKPFVTEPAESDELLAEADKRGLKIAVAHTMRMTPVMVHLKQAILEGRIGDIVEARAFGKQDARAGGEDMMVLGSHLFDLLRLFLGDPLWCTARVLWQGRDIAPNDRRLVKDNVGWVAGDEVFAQFAFLKGVNATFTSAAKLKDTVEHWGIEFLGSKGAARINCDIAPNVFVCRSSGWKSDGKTDAWEPLDMSRAKSRIPQNLGPVGDWLDAIAKNREPECSGRNGAWAVEMVMGVYHSALSGRRVSFPLSVRSHALR
jgi:predicted dehydrogenase